MMISSVLCRYPRNYISALSGPPVISLSPAAALIEHMESRADIIDLAAFRKNESQELSLSDLVEQAEALVILQEAALDQSLSRLPASKSDTA